MGPPARSRPLAALGTESEQPVQLLHPPSVGLCAVFAFVAFRAFEKGQRGWAWTLGITAAIYNPLAPVHLARSIWSLVNVVTVGIAVASMFLLNPTQEPRGSSAPSSRSE